MTIDTAKFASPALIYRVTDAATTFSWNDAALISTGILTDCGTYTWMVTEIDGTTAIDSSIFTSDLENKTIKVYTADLLKVATYTMQVKVYYTDFPTFNKTLNFSIIVTSLDFTAFDSTKFGREPHKFDESRVYENAIEVK